MRKGAKLTAIVITVALAVMAMFDIGTAMTDNSRRLVQDSAAKTGPSGETAVSRQVTDQDLQVIAERFRDFMTPLLRGSDLAVRKDGTGKSRIIDNLPVSLSDLGAGLSKLRNNVKLYDRNGTPVFITGLEEAENTMRKISVGEPTYFNRVIDFLADNKDLFRLADPEMEMIPVREISDALGFTHVIFDQYYDGIPVWNRNLAAHFRADGQMYAINGRYIPSPVSADNVTPALSRDEAIRIAVDDLSSFIPFRDIPAEIRGVFDYSGPLACLYIWTNEEYNVPRLVWHVEIRPNMVDWYYYFIDAASGKILEKYNNTKFDGPVTGTGTDLAGASRSVPAYQQGSSYRMIDASRPMWQASQSDPWNDPKGAIATLTLNNQPYAEDSPIYWVSSSNNTWSDPASVSAHYHAGLTYAYYYDNHGRQSIDDNSRTIYSIVNMGAEGGGGMDNAFYNGIAYFYGTGASEFYNLAGGLDVVAHEMTHGVVSYTAQLEYRFQSGALNETFADIGGALVDDVEWWKIGEDVVKNMASFPTGMLRDMSNPHNGGTSLSDPSWQPEHMDEYVNLDFDQDNGGVHINGGITARAAYLIGDAIGHDKMGDIFYRTLDAGYLNKTSQFIDMRLAAIQAAKDLYGETSAEVDAVMAAYDAVGIIGDEDDGSDPDPDHDPVDGIEWIATVDTEWDSSLYIIRPVIDNPQDDIVQLTTTQVNTMTGKPLDVSKDGSAIIFVDADNYIRAVAVESGEEIVLSAYGEWNSVALSSTGNLLAANTIYEDSSIYIFDLFNPENSIRVKLYSPTSSHGGENAYITEFADVMEWGLTDDFLVFDAYNSYEQEGMEVSFWEIYMYDLTEDAIFRMFAPLPDGQSMGNPSFAERNDRYMVFDYIDLNTCDDEIIAVDFFESEVGLIFDAGCDVFNGFPNLGFPKYNPDDDRMVYQHVEGGEYYLYQIALDETRIGAAGSPDDFVKGGMLPAWFAIGEWTTEVEEEDPSKDPENLPVTFRLEQNYPNPFNPATTIGYTIDRKAAVQLTVYNILGREVRVLVDEPQRAGSHYIAWDGRDNAGMPVASGVYFYRLTAGNQTVTKKMTLLK